MQLVTRVTTKSQERVEVRPEFWNISDQCVRVFFPLGSEKAKKINQLHNFIENVEVFLDDSDEEKKSGETVRIFKLSGYKYTQFEKVNWMDRKFFCIHLDNEGGLKND